MSAIRLFKPVANRQVSLFMLYSSILQIGLFGITDVILNFYFTSLGHSPETIGVLQSFPRISGLLISIPAGLVASRLGAYRVILYATVGIGAAMLMPLLWPDLPILGLSRFLLGVFYGAQQVAINPFIGGLVKRDEQPFLFSYHNIITMIATAVGSFIGGFLPALMVSLGVRGAGDLQQAAQSSAAYRGALAVGVIVTLTCLLPLMWVQEQRTSGTNVNIGRVNLREMPWRTLLLFAIPMYFFGFTGGLTFPFYNLFFRNTFHVSDEIVGTILGIGWIGMGIIPLVNPVLDKRYGRAEALFITLSVAAVAFFGLSIAPTLGLSIVAYVIATSARNTMQPLFQPLVMSTLPPHAHNMASGIGLVVWNIGWFNATTISGFLQAEHGFQLIMQVVAAGVMLTAITVVLIFRNRPQHVTGIEVQNP
ncbi:MAG: MFS transporter [Chloroflexi bacterium]|nr:MFS transporter [Chloroflexota bacterium]MCC6895316.1 MFS transporter [Anaerolineae bacterium]